MTWEFGSGTSRHNPPRILCVDDDRSILLLVQRLLQMQGFEPVGFSDPELAI